MYLFGHPHRPKFGSFGKCFCYFIEDIDRWYLDYEYFVHAHILKKNNNGQLVMMYLGYTTEILLPDWNLSLYAVNSFVFDLQVKEVAPRRSASMRITRNL